MTSKESDMEGKGMEGKERTEHLNNKQGQEQKDNQCEGMTIKAKKGTENNKYKKLKEKKEQCNNKNRHERTGKQRTK